MMQFKKIFIAGISGSILSAAVGIKMALSGYGLWSIVTAQLVNITIVTAVMWFTVAWHPALCFSSKRLLALVSFGGRILASNLLPLLFFNVRAFVIGKIFSAANLGYFNRGRQFPQAMMEGINGTIQTVMLPVFAAVQDNPDMLKNAVRRSCRLSALLLYPLFIGLAVAAKPLVILLLSEKWLPAVVFVQIFALSYLFQPTQVICGEAYKALGFSRLTLKLEIIRKTIEITLFVISVRYGLAAIAVSDLLAGLCAIVMTLRPNNCVLGYSYREQMMDIGPVFVSAAMMGGAVWLIARISLPPFLQVGIQVVAGAAIYFAAAWCMKVQGIRELKDIVFECLCIGEVKAQSPVPQYNESVEEMR